MTPLPSPFSSSSNSEVRALADTVFDGQADMATIKRLESLITSDLGCLQAYVQHLNFHGVISQMARNRTPEEAAVAVLQDFSKAVRIRDRRERWTWSLLTAALTCSLLLIVGTFAWRSGAFRASPLATISSLSTNLQTRGGSMELGRIVRRGESVTVTEGVLSLQFPHVMVDVLGPATFQLEGPSRILLKTGTLVAKVDPQGAGFTIKTPTAEVVDFGTEFRVQHLTAKGTDVSVRQGRVRASLLDQLGQPTQLLELTDHRAAEFPISARAAREVNYQPQDFTPIDRIRGGIRSIDGMLRTTPQAPASLLNGQVLTHNHILIIPEQQQVILDRDLVLDGLEGPLQIPAGSSVSSYLVHYDPPGDLSRAPRGAVTFNDQIAAIVVKTADLTATDTLLGLPGTQFESESFRGLELGLDEDKAQVSGDRHTVSFHFDMSPPQNLDEARVLIITNPNAPPPAP